MIRRPLYMDKLKDYATADLVKIIVGVRRCGKSTLLKQLQNDLREAGISPDEMLSIDFELPSNAELTDSTAFIKYVTSRLHNDKLRYLFVDEAQELNQWEKTINGLRAEYGLNIFVTGSNAHLFAGEDMTYLSGRYVKMPVYPLSLAEYCQFCDVDVTDSTAVQAAYDDYVREGGFPAITLASSNALKEAMMDGIYDSVLTRDVILRGKIRNEAAFRRVLAFVMENVGNQTSALSIERALKGGGHTVRSETIDNYLSLMEKAHLLYKCERYDLRGKERLRTNGKYYVVDTGLRNRTIGLKDSNRGHVTENTVFLELLRRDYEVNVGTFPNAEIDFVAQRGSERLYIQVCETLMDPQTFERELMPFSKLDDAHPRILISKDSEDYARDGVRHINLYDFLLGEPLG